MIIKKIGSFPKGVKASIAFFLSSLVTKGIAFITTPIFTRLLTAEEFGQVSLYYTWYKLFGIIAMFCLCYLETTIINGMWQKHLLSMLPAAMDTLSEKERRVMELYYLDWTQRTEAEVGRVLGISQQAIHKTRVRAIEKLRKFYENQGC